MLCICIGGMSQFTAEEMKTFTIVYSRWLLKPVLPKAHYDMWSSFVKATTLLTRPIVKRDDLDAAQKHFVSFTSAFTELCGKPYWTPNMHLMFHIVDDIKNFGPVYAYHLFAMERYNGLIEGISTDNRSPQVTYMRYISHLQALCVYPYSGNSNFTPDEIQAWKKVYE